jgi:hypothetical protein
MGEGEDGEMGRGKGGMEISGQCRGNFLPGAKQNDSK